MFENECQNVELAQEQNSPSNALAQEQKSQNSKANRLAIASIVLSSIGVVIAIIALAFCVTSLVVGANSDNNVGDGIGSVLLFIYSFIFSIPGMVFGITSLGLGIPAVVKAKEKSVKGKGIAGTVMSAMTLVACIFAIIVRLIVEI